MSKPFPTRKFHQSLGLGVCIEAAETNSGEPAAKIVFDSDPKTERTILLTFLSDSPEPLPAYASDLRRPVKKSKPIPQVEEAETPKEETEEYSEECDEQEEQQEKGASLVGGNTKFCNHGFIIPVELILYAQSRGAKALLSGTAKRSPYCLDCWSSPDTAKVFSQRFYERPAVADPIAFGFCNLMKSVISKRGFFRDAYTKESKMMDLRLRLLQKRSEIEKAIAGQSPELVTNYIRRVLKNQLTNDQTSSEGKIISNSIKSLSGEVARTDRRALAAADAGNQLTELSGGDTKYDDDNTLDEKDALVQDASAEETPKKGKSEARALFDTLAAEANSQIAQLTGTRKNGFDSMLDLEHALGKLPDSERVVFDALYCENGELLGRPRTYSEAEFLTGLTLQNVRTLEKRAIQTLRPVLAPSFFKRRQA